MADNQASLRCADADREHVAGVLREHYAEGRLDLNEFQERTDTVYAAKTFADLAPVTRDLPALETAELPEQKDEDLPARAALVGFLPLLVVLIACTAWMAGSVASGHSGALWPAFIVFFAIMGRRGCGGRTHRVR